MRASCLLALGLTISWCPGPWASAVVPDRPTSNSPPLTFAELTEQVAKLSQQPFEPRPPLSPELAALEYEQYREIQFRPEQGTWWGSDSPFCLETFHRGFVQRDRISLFVIEDGEVSEIPFATDDFEYGIPLKSPDQFDGAGHAGLKVVGRFPGYSDAQEMLTFLGSSYFRARSGETIYGASARGLAVDVGMPSDEEFPFFRSFWVYRPRPGDQTLKLLALMDSPSVCGAYQFELTPGHTETRVGVECALYFRVQVEKIGIAPLTSMWIWGDGLAGPPLDKRPSVHDSDGLLVRTETDRWIWRTFARQDYPSVTQLQVDGLRGFGLLQRNRAFYHFDDYNALYHKRPSVWVEPDVSWQAGAIELLELPGAHEGIDNIAAYWVPNEMPVPGEPLSLKYDVVFFPGDQAGQSFVARATNFTIERGGKDAVGLGTAGEPPHPNPLPRKAGGEGAKADDASAHPNPLRSKAGGDVASAEDANAQADRLSSKAGLSETETEDDTEQGPEPIKLTVRFAGQAVKQSAVARATVNVSLVRGELISKSLEVTETDDWICSIEFRCTEDAPVEIKLSVSDDGGELTELFSYLCPPDEPEFMYPQVYTRKE